MRRAYREGAFVRKGEVLFEIDRRPFEAALSQAQARLAEAEAQLAKTRARSRARSAARRAARHRAESARQRPQRPRRGAGRACRRPKAAVESARAEPRLHPRHLADRRRRRDRQRADRRPGRADDAAHDGLAGGSDQGLLPDQRAGVPRASPRRSHAGRDRPARGRASGGPGARPRRRQHVSARAAPSSPSIARSTRRWAPSASARPSRIPATCCGPASSGACGRRSASRKQVLLVPQRAVAELQSGYQMRVVEGRRHGRGPRREDRAAGSATRWIVTRGCRPATA